jgi:hypothetical protein
MANEIDAHTGIQPRRRTVRRVALDTIAALLDRVVPVVAGVRRAVGTLALLGGLAGALIGWALFADGLPSDGGELVARFVVLVVACVPPGVLLMLWLALGEVIEIPERVRRLPETARGHAGDLERALRELEGTRGRRKRRVVVVWRLAKLPATARESLMIYAPLMALLSVPFLAAAALSAVLVPIELIVALIVALLAV